MIGVAERRGLVLRVELTEDWTTSPDVDTEAGRDSDDRSMSTQP